MFRHHREIHHPSYRRIRASLAVLLLTLLSAGSIVAPAAAQTTDPSGSTTCTAGDPTCDPNATTSGATGEEPPPGGGTDEWDTDVLNSPLRSPGLPQEPALWPALQQAVRQALETLLGAQRLDRLPTHGDR
jgi:hypothetical protein